MKRLFKRNQVIITGLALMIAVAGYLNYSGYFKGDKDAKANNTLANLELLDISLEDTEETSEIQETPGEAVLTGGNAIVANAKMTREQVRSQNKETLLEIINNASLSEEQKADAVAQMIAMTEVAEMEATVETMLLTKGFSEAVVTLTENGADIVINGAEISDANLAQIEDIVTRQTGVLPENIVINSIAENE